MQIERSNEFRMSKAQAEGDSSIASGTSTEQELALAELTKLGQEMTLPPAEEARRDAEIIRDHARRLGMLFQIEAAAIRGAILSVVPAHRLDAILMADPAIMPTAN